VALPEREFGVRKKWDGIVKLGEKSFQFKHPKRVGPAGKKALRELIKRERHIIAGIRALADIADETAREEEAERLEAQHRELNLDHLAIYLGQEARAELAADEENYPADELALVLKFVMESKAADQPSDPLGSESLATWTGTSSLPV